MLICNAQMSAVSTSAKNELGAPVAAAAREGIRRIAARCERQSRDAKEGPGDLSHYTSSVRFALWNLERPRFNN